MYTHTLYRTGNQVSDQICNLHEVTQQVTVPAISAFVVLKFFGIKTHSGSSKIIFGF